MTVLVEHRIRRALAVVAGLLLPLAFAPFGFFWLAPASVVVLTLLWDRTTPREAAAIGCFYGLGAFSFGTYWLYISLRQLGGAPIPIVLLLMSGLVFAMSAYSALTGALLARLTPERGLMRWLVGLPAIWVLVDWLRGWFLTGFPWLSLGYSQTESLLAGFAPVAGIHGVTAAVVFVAGSCVALVLGPDRVTRGAAFAALVAVIGSAALLRPVQWTAAGSSGVDVALIQAAIPQEQKWRPSQLQPTLDFYRDTTLGLTEPDLVIWPEAAIPALPFEVRDFLLDLDEQMTEQGTQLYSGILTYEPDRSEFRNTLMGFGAYTGQYHKRHLVPFGEYFPVPQFVSRWLRLMNLPSEDITPGPAQQSPLRVGDIMIAPSICYEVAFGSEQLGFLPAAGLLLNISNDTWFGDSIAPHQHLQMAKMRAIEVARPMLRATNTGLTAAIGADGAVIAQIRQFEPGVLTATVYPRSGATPYSRFGNYPVVFICVVLAVLSALRRRRGDSYSS